MPWVVEKAPGKKWVIEAREPDKAPVRPEARPTTPLTSIPGRALRSLPSSVGGVIKDTASAVLNPVDTMHSLGKTLTGAANLALPEGVPELTYYGHGAVDPSTGVEEAKAVGQMYKDQYGGYENIKNTLATDPAQPIMDALMLASGGGSALARAPGLAGRIGTKLATPGRAIAAAPSKAVHGIAKKLYGGSLKFPKETGFTGRKKAIDVGRKQGITMDEKGTLRLQGQIGDLGKELDDVLLKAEGAGAQIEVIELWDKVDELKAASELSARPIKLQRAVDGIINEHLIAMENAGKNFYTPKDLNTLKRSLAKRAKYSSAPGTTSLPDEALVNERAASVARETLEGIDPSIRGINEQLSPRMALRDPQYASAFHGKLTSDHPIIAGSFGRMAGGTPAGMGAMLFGPRLMAKSGIKATQIADSPILKALSGPIPATAYSTTRLTPKKNKKKKRR